MVGSRAIAAGSDADKRVMREQLTLLLDSGDLVNYDLSAINSLRLVDSHLEEQLKQYLQTLAQSKSRDSRSVYIDSAGHGERNLRVSYISSYSNLEIFVPADAGRSGLAARRLGDCG